jgi:hypothetical protein
MNLPHILLWVSGNPSLPEHRATANGSPSPGGEGRGVGERPPSRFRSAGSWAGRAISSTGLCSASGARSQMAVFRSADFQSAVSPICNRLRSGPAGASEFGKTSPIATAAGYKPNAARICAWMTRPTSCPGGARDNSPTLQRWVGHRWIIKSRRDGRTRRSGPPSAVPSGLIHSRRPVPTLKRWAIFGHPSGMRLNEILVGHQPAIRQNAVLRYELARLSRSTSENSHRPRIFERRHPLLVTPPFWICFEFRASDFGFS